MDIRELSPAYAVSPQLDPEDATAIAAAGYRVVLCNRPEMEVPPSHQAAAIQAAVEAAGMRFVFNPFSHQALTQDILDLQAETIAAEDGPVLAYCASGTRCTILWLLTAAQAGQNTAPMLTAAATAGYQLDHLAPQLDALAQQN